MSSGSKRSMRPTVPVELFAPYFINLFSLSVRAAVEFALLWFLPRDPRNAPCLVPRRSRWLQGCPTLEGCRLHVEHSAAGPFSSPPSHRRCPQRAIVTTASRQCLLRVLLEGRSRETSLQETPGRADQTQTIHEPNDDLSLT